jgi:intein/homing endonuclease
MKGMVHINAEYFAMPKQPLWSPLEIDIITSYYRTMSNQEICKLLPGRTIAAVSLKAKSLGLKRDLSHAHRKHDLNFDYFSHPTLENCYWAGFIAADGCVSQDKRRLRIKLSDVDADHLEKFREAINYSGNLYYGKNKNKRYVALEFKGVRKIIEDLERNFGIVPQKSLIIQPPENLSENLALAFIIGYIDGDGCIHRTYSKNRTKLRLHVVGTKFMCEWIKAQLSAVCPPSYQAHVRPMKSVYVWSVAGFHGEEILRHLQEFDVPKMIRKWSNVSSMASV